jgi:prepilin-type N-terminal cleavage/methylation domain-containing protein
MFNWMSKQVRKKKGFTLIELIVVIAILALLAVIAIPRLAGISARAETTACEGTQRTIASAASIYEANTGTQTTVIATLVTAGLLAETPVCPASTPGTYTIATNGTVDCSVH